jgi:hypothetical protein
VTVTSIDAPIQPTHTGVERDPTNPHRLLLQFDYGRKIQLSVHSVLYLIESLSMMVKPCIVSEYEMELGAVERKRLAETAPASRPPQERQDERTKTMKS